MKYKLLLCRCGCHFPDGRLLVSGCGDRFGRIDGYVDAKTCTSLQAGICGKKNLRLRPTCIICSIGYDYLDSYTLLLEAVGAQSGTAAAVSAQAIAETPAPTADPNQTVTLQEAFGTVADTQDAAVYTKPANVPWPRVTVAAYALTVKDRGDTRIMGLTAGRGAHTWPLAGITRFNLRGWTACTGKATMCLWISTIRLSGCGESISKPGILKTRIPFRELSVTGYPGITVTSVETYYGAGRWPYNKIDGGTLSAGAAVTVFWEERNYVFAEFNMEDGVVRGWIETRAMSSRCKLPAV